MNDMLQIRNHELGDILRLLRSLFPKYLVYVNQNKESSAILLLMK